VKRVKAVVNTASGIDEFWKRKAKERRASVAREGVLKASGKM